MLALGSNARGRSGLLSILRPQDVFKTSLYTGNGGTQTIIDGFDPDLVWGKARAGQYAGDSSFGRHVLVDRVRGAGRDLATNLTDAEQTGSNAINFATSGGHVVGGATKINEPNTTFVNWAFRRATKFLDIVTWTGNGTRNTTFANATNAGFARDHALGIKPGAIIIKPRTSATKNDWLAAFRSDGNYGGQILLLNSSAGPEFSSTSQLDAFSTATTFTPGSFRDGSGNFNAWNENGVEYVAYLFAHDPDPNGIIQCGSFTLDSGGATTGNVPVGWRSQFLLAKPFNQPGDWIMLDTARGWGSGNDAVLRANTSGAETSEERFQPNATGFTFTGGPASATYAYMTIRAPI